MKRISDWRIFFATLAVIAVLTAGLSRWLHLNYWVVFAITVVAVKLNGLAADWEDKQPGGLLNPKPD